MSYEHWSAGYQQDSKQAAGCQSFGLAIVYDWLHESLVLRSRFCLVREVISQTRFGDWLENEARSVHQALEYTSGGLLTIRRQEPRECLKWRSLFRPARSLAYIERGACRLVSRNAHDFRSFPGLCDSLATALGLHSAILNGEIVCLDRDGRARFNALLYRRQEPYYYAFDCLWLDGRDLRQLPLIERKQILRTLVPAQPSRLLYVSHIEEHGVDLLRAVREQDLEGIVAKLKTAPYGTEPPSWVKIKNPEYSQAKDRHEQFEQMRARRAAAECRAGALDCPELGKRPEHSP